MRIVYIPDWGEKIDEHKMKIMSKHGCDLHVMSIDYINRNIIQYIEKELFRCPSLIVGNSLGAYFGFYASNNTEIPALLFNPSFYFRNGGELKSEKRNGEFLNKKIILSTKDEVVDTKRSFKLLRELGYESQIKVIDNQIDYQSFENFFVDFYMSNIDFKHPMYEQEKKSSKKSYSEKISTENIWRDGIAATAEQITITAEQLAGQLINDDRENVRIAAEQIISRPYRTTVRFQGEAPDTLENHD